MQGWWITDDRQAMGHDPRPAQYRALQARPGRGALFPRQGRRAQEYH